MNYKLTKITQEQEDEIKKQIQRSDRIVEEESKLHRFNEIRDTIWYRTYERIYGKR